MEVAGVEAGAKMLVGLEACPAAHALPEIARAKQRPSFVLFPAGAFIASLTRSSSLLKCGYQEREDFLRRSYQKKITVVHLQFGPLNKSMAGAVCR
jgi:hypothetical protein